MYVKKNNNLLSIKKDNASMTYQHRGINEEIVINKYQLQYVIDTLIKKNKGPKFEHWSFVLGAFLVLIYSLLGKDFKEFLGIQAPVWEAITLILAILSGMITIALFSLWLINKICRKQNNPEEVIEQIINQMENDYQKIASTSYSKNVNRRERIK
jgi:hypothetical protein